MSCRPRAPPPPPRSPTSIGCREAGGARPDGERLTAGLACGRATRRDLGALRNALDRLPAIAAALSRNSIARTALEPPPGLPDLLRRALTDEPPPLSRDGDVI